MTSRTSSEKRSRLRLSHTPVSYTHLLLKEQTRDGSWGSHTRTKGLNVICPYPEGPRSFRTASTSLCVIGLLTSPLRCV